jgi:hypothetical protein
MNRQFTDLPVRAEVQELNGLDMGRVLHSKFICTNIIDHIAQEMRKKIVQHLPDNNIKISVLVDESKTISNKPVLVLCLDVSCHVIPLYNLSFVDGSIIENQGTKQTKIREGNIEIPLAFQLVSSKVDLECDGLLGRDFLQQTQAQICYKTRTLTFQYQGSVVERKLISKLEKDSQPEKKNRTNTRSDKKYPGQKFLKNYKQYRSDNHVGYLATSPDVTYHRSRWQFDLVVSEVIYSAIVFVPPSYCEMDVLKEKRVCINFCQKLGKTATETYEMPQQAFGETALSLFKTSEWYSRFKNGRTSIDNDPHTGRPLSLTRRVWCITSFFPNARP